MTKHNHKNQANIESPFGGARREESAAKTGSTITAPRDKRRADFTGLPTIANATVKVNSDGNAQLNFHEVAKIEAVKNNDNGSVIVFEKIKAHEIESDKFEEIGADRVVGAMSNVVAAGTQIAAVSALNSLGLFRATVTPKLLAMFADGNFSTFSTILSRSKTVVSQTGFKALSATVFAPIAVMQLLAMVTGQYYMNGISRQLQDIDSKIGQLIKFHHTEKISRLESAQSLLKNLFDVRNPGIEHVTQLKTMEYEIGSIFREYSKYLDETDYNFLNAEGLKFSSKKDVARLLKIQDQSGFDFNLYMVMTADEILHLLMIIELVVNVKLNFVSGDRSNQIAELYDKISGWTPEDFFAQQHGRGVLARYFVPFVERAKRIRDHCWSRVGKARVEKSIANLDAHCAELLEKVTHSCAIYELRDQLIDYMNQPIELLYTGNAEDGTLYIKKTAQVIDDPRMFTGTDFTGAEEVNENYAL